jgi:hypothetical protein
VQILEFALPINHSDPRIGDQPAGGVTNAETPQIPVPAATQETGSVFRPVLFSGQPRGLPSPISWGPDHGIQLGGHRPKSIAFSRPGAFGAWHLPVGENVVGSMAQARHSGAREGRCWGSTLSLLDDGASVPHIPMFLRTYCSQMRVSPRGLYGAGPGPSAWQRPSLAGLVERFLTNLMALTHMFLFLLRLPIPYGPFLFSSLSHPTRPPLNPVAREQSVHWPS